MFRTKNLLAAITRVQVALENSFDQKLSSHFFIIKTASWVANIELDIRGARDTDIEFMNCMTEEVDHYQ